MCNLYNNILGNLTFHIGWIKYETLTLWEGQDYNLRIRISCKKDELPTQVQEKAYQEFKRNLKLLCDSTIVQIYDFVLNKKELIQSQCEDVSVNNPFSIIFPKEVLFFQSGAYAIICDTKWSEQGVAVLVKGPNIIVDESYILEFEE